MKDLGVSDKQVSKARQALQRSTEQADFFAHGKDRLVAPADRPPTRAEEPKAAIPSTAQFEHDPLIVGLFRKFPPAGAGWSASDQQTRLDLATHILPAVYGSED
jgi:hypothetical protein